MWYADLFVSTWICYTKFPLPIKAFYQPNGPICHRRRPVLLQYSCFSNLSQISSENVLGRGFFFFFFFFFFFLSNIFAKIEITPNENRLFGRHFGTVQILNFFFCCWNMVVISVYAYGIEIFKNSGGIVVFLEGSMPPYAPNGRSGYLNAVKC